MRVLKRWFAAVLLALAVVSVNCSDMESPPAGQTKQPQVGEAAAVQAQSPAESRQQSSQPAPEPPLIDADEVVVELRVWQSVDDPATIWASAWLEGQVQSEPERTLIKMTCSLESGDYSSGRHWYGTVHVAAATARTHSTDSVLLLHQQEGVTGIVHVQACSDDACLDSRCPVRGARRPLGLTRLALKPSESGDPGKLAGTLRVAVPRNNPALLRDREHLLALRDVLEGGATELDWSVETPTTTWEGVTVSGSPPRVTGLDLSNRGLSGELWGYIGDLAELADLRLDGNGLGGILPSNCTCCPSCPSCDWLGMTSRAVRRPGSGRRWSMTWLSPVCRNVTISSEANPTTAPTSFTTSARWTRTT